jgi:hypothetical protein
MNALCAQCYIPPSNQSIEAGNSRINSGHKRRLLEPWLKHLLEVEAKKMARHTMRLRYGPRLSKHTNTNKFNASALLVAQGSNNRQDPLHLKFVPFEVSKLMDDGRIILPVQGGPAELSLDDRRGWKVKSKSSGDVPGKSDATKPHEWKQISTKTKSKSKKTKTKSKSKKTAKNKNKNKKEEREAGKSKRRGHTHATGGDNSLTQLLSTHNNSRGAIKTYVETIRDNDNVSGLEATAHAALSKWLWSTRVKGGAALGQGYIDLIERPASTMDDMCSDNKSTRPKWYNMMEDRHKEEFATSPTDAVLWLLSQFVVLTPITDLAVAAHRYSLLKQQKYNLRSLRTVLKACKVGEGLMQCNCPNAMHYGSCPHSVGDLISKGLIKTLDGQGTKDPTRVDAKKKPGKKKGKKGKKGKKKDLVAPSFGFINK